MGTYKLLSYVHRYLANHFRVSNHGPITDNGDDSMSFIAVSGGLGFRVTVEPVELAT